MDNPSELADLQSDAELLSIFVETGKRAAMEALVRRHAPMVAGVARRMLSSASDAEDVFQATFLVLLKSAKKIRNGHSLASWLYGVAFRTAQRQRQRIKARGTSLLEEDIVNDPKMVDEPLSLLARQMELESLDEELRELPTRLREPLIEHYLLGFSASKIAERMELSQSAVEGRLRRGRRMLRQRLAQRGLSLSVVLAGAAWFQGQTQAAELEPWVDHFLDSSGLSDMTSVEPPDIRDPDLSYLVRGETMMRSSAALKWLGVGGSGFFAAGILGLITTSLPGGSFGNTSGSSERTLSVASDGEANGETEIYVNANATQQFGGGLSGAAGAGGGSLLGAGGGDAGGASDGGGASGQAGGGLGGAAGQGVTGAGGQPLVSGGMGMAGMGGTYGGGAMGGMGGGGMGEMGGGMPGSLGVPDVDVPFSPPQGEKPNWLEAGESEVTASEAVRKQLRRSFSPDFNQVPLKNVLEQISNELGVSILLDERSISEAGQSAEEPISLTAAEMPMTEVLHLILDPLNLSYQVEPHHIRIAAGDSIQPSLRFYDLAHVLPSSAGVRALVQTIEQQVDQGEWTSNGGNHSISMIGSLMVVNTNEEAHAQIERILSRLSQVNPDNLKAAAATAGSSGSMMGGMGGMGGGGGGFF